VQISVGLCRISFWGEAIAHIRDSLAYPRSVRKRKQRTRQPLFAPAMAKHASIPMPCSDDRKRHAGQGISASQCMYCVPKASARPTSGWFPDANWRKKSGQLGRWLGARTGALAAHNVTARFWVNISSPTARRPMHFSIQTPACLHPSGSPLHQRPITPL
jgi:hypothetical protein